jgi:VanZ family protein
VNPEAFIETHRVTLRRLWTAGLLLYLGLIALASLLPPPELPLDPGRFDKLWHAFGYALAGLGCVPLLRRPSALLAAALALAGYGLLMEFLQGAGGVRSFDWMDALANGFGACVGLGAGFSRLRGLLARPSAS